MVQEIYLKLTKDQKLEGIIFSSTLSEYRSLSGNETTHNILCSMPIEQQKREIGYLKNDKFFNKSQYKYNIIRS